MKWYIIFACLFIVSCGGKEGLPLGKIYEQAAKNENRNPVVVIHGVTGARLVQEESGKVVWGAFDKSGIDPNSSEGMRALALPIWKTKKNFSIADIASLQDDVHPSGPLDKIKLNLLGINISIDVYLSILATLGVGGYIDEVLRDVKYDKDHYTCFSFFYDWRKDNITNAIELGKFLEKTAKYVEKKDAERGFERGKVRFDLVAHSMGGLIARYYLQYGATDVAQLKNKEITWAGAERVSRLIQVGSPNTGSISAVESLINGQEYSFVLPKFQAALLATYPSLYQLLPRLRHNIFVDENGESVNIDFYDASVWLKNKWGIFSDEQFKYLKLLLPELDNPKETAHRYVQAALDRAKEFHRALDAESKSQCPAEIFLFASKSNPTQAQVRVQKISGKWNVSFDPELTAPGDGVVTIANALSDKRQGQKWTPWVRSSVPFKAIYLLDGDHLSMTTTRAFDNNILHLLLEQPPLK